MKKNLFRISFILLLTAVFMYFFFKNVEWSEVWTYLGRVRGLYFILFCLMAPLHLVTRALRWQCLLKHEKKTTSLYNRIAANAVGFTVTDLIPGRIGELVKPLYLAQKEGMKKGFVIATAVIERLFDVFTMCFLLGLFLLARPLYTSIFPIESDIQSRLTSLGIIGLAASLVLLLLSLSLFFFKEKTLGIFRFMMRPLPDKITRKILDLAEEFIQGLRFFHSLKDLVAYFLWSVFVWMAMMVMYWVFLYAYDIKIPFFMVFPWLFLLAVGAAIPTPGMVAGFHYFSRVGLVSLFHVELNLAVGMTLVCHAVQVVLTCLVGFAILWKEGISFLQLKKLGQSPEKS